MWDYSKTELKVSADASPELLEFEESLPENVRSRFWALWLDEGFRKAVIDTYAIEPKLSENLDTLASDLLRSEPELHGIIIECALDASRFKRGLFEPDDSRSEEGPAEDTEPPESDGGR